MQFEVFYSVFYYRTIEVYKRGGWSKEDYLELSIIGVYDYFAFRMSALKIYWKSLLFFLERLRISAYTKHEVLSSYPNCFTRQGLFSHPISHQRISQFHRCFTESICRSAPYTSLKRSRNMDNSLSIDKKCCSY